MNSVEFQCQCASAMCRCERPMESNGLDKVEPKSGLDSSVDILKSAEETVNIIIGDQTFTVNKKLVIENSSLIKTALEENLIDNDVRLPWINDNKCVKEFTYFLEFLKYKYIEIKKPLPERGAHFTKDNCGSDENVNFINNFYDKTVLKVRDIPLSKIQGNKPADAPVEEDLTKTVRKEYPLELENSMCMANYLGATKFLDWCCAKYASVLIEMGIAKVD
jgi:hypothetical protein